MHCSVAAKISFISSRNCFVGLPKSLTSRFSNDKVNGIKIESLTSSLCTSWAGDVTGNHQLELDDTVEINGLFASKLGFYNKQEVTVSVLPAICDCISAEVEPASVDDWEILEMNASTIESSLLNQVRVVSVGQIFPIWVQKSTCIYVTIGHLEPSSSICSLQTNTELVIAPKSRRSFVQKNNSLHSSYDRTHSKVENSSKLNGMIPNGSHATATRSSNENSAGFSNDSNSQNDKQSLGFLSYLTSLWKDSNKYDVNGSQLPSKIDKCLSENFSAFFRVLALEDFIDSNNDSDHFSSAFDCTDSFDASLQPCNIFISRESILTVSGLSSYDLPSCFLARISKLPSPEEKKDSLKQKVRLKASYKSFSKVQEKVQSIDQIEAADDRSNPSFAVVRVMIVLLDNCCRINEWINFRCKNMIPYGHALIHSYLRRMLHIEKTSRIQIDPLKTLKYSIPREISLHRLFPVPEGFTDEMLQIAAKQWVESLTRPFCPLVLNNGTFFKCFIKEGLIGEFFLTFDNGSEKESCERPYFFLSPRRIGEMKLTSSSMHQASFHSPQPLLEFDSDLPSATIDQFYIDTAVKTAMIEYVDICVSQHSVARQLFYRSSSGLANGALLLCGAKGSGKTSIGLTICNAASSNPYYAFVETVDCKMLKGKKPETIRQYFEQKFDELSWRQPSVLFLDDLDHLTASSAGPQQDISGLASYYTRVAEILRDLIQQETFDASSIAIVATAVSCNSIHTLLVAARGSHVFTRIIEIKPPNQNNRNVILHCLLRNRKDIADDCINNLNLSKISSQTEGYAVKDLDQIVDRAIHATLLSSQRNSSCEIAVVIFL